MSLPRRYAQAVASSAETVTILRPVSEVFAYTADLRNEPSWDMEVEAVPLSAGALARRGEPNPVTFRPFLGEQEGTLTIVEAVLDARLRLEAVYAGLTSQITYVYTPMPGGTSFTRLVDVRPVGMLRLLAPLIAWRISRINRRDVWNLKRLLEAG